MNVQLTEKPLLDNNTKKKKEEMRKLLLHNDEQNTFDFVIKSLIEICKHELTQAEQCTLIVHYKGSCDIKKGSYDELKPLKEEFITRGLNATIE